MVRLTKTQAGFIGLLSRLQASRPAGEGVPAQELRKARKVSISAISAMKGAINKTVASETGGAIPELITTIGRTNYRLVDGAERR